MPRLSAGVSMRRRDFFALAGIVAAGWSLPARTQQLGRATIGFLGATTSALQTQWTAAFVPRLRELGWIECQTVAIEFRWGEGDRA